MVIIQLLSIIYNNVVKIILEPILSFELFLLQSQKTIKCCFPSVVADSPPSSMSQQERSVFIKETSKIGKMEENGSEVLKLFLFFESWSFLSSCWKLVIAARRRRLGLLQRSREGLLARRSSLWRKFSFFGKTKRVRGPECRCAASQCARNDPRVLAC